MSDIYYTLVVSGERFELTKDQLLSDPRNFFVTFFLGHFAEAAAGVRELIISKEPMLFKLIQAHLRGYEILPLASTAIPSYMTPETTIINLAREADYYGLGKLVERLDTFRENPAASTTAVGVSREAKEKQYMIAREEYDDEARDVYWNTCELSYEGFQAWLAKAKPTAAAMFREGHEDIFSPRLTGFRQVVGWRESARVSSASDHMALYGLFEST